MAILYGRRIEVDVAGLTFKKIRISVELEREIDETQLKGRIDLYNLNEQNEGLIHKRGGPVTVRAGYPETIAEIYVGEAQRIVRAREDLAKITRIHIGDQVRHKDRLGGIAAISYNGERSIRSIVKDLAGDMDLPLGPLDAIPAGETYAYFYFAGVASDALTYILERVDCRWFEEDGLIRINKAGMMQADAPTITVSPETGLIKTPIRTDEGAEIQMFLNPAVKLGCIMIVESETLTGRWKVVGLRHNADNWEGAFLTWCDLREMA